MSRVVLYKNCKLTLDTDEAFTELIETLKKSTGKQKENVDLLKINDGKLGMLVAVHLNSSSKADDSKNEESNSLLNLIRAVGNRVIVAGDFNYPYYPDLGDGAKIFSDGFGYDGSISSERWNTLKKELNLQPIPNCNLAGYRKKERFSKRLGNDQFEGKMDLRSYNTDFIGGRDTPACPLTVK